MAIAFINGVHGTNHGSGDFINATTGAMDTSGANLLLISIGCYSPSGGNPTSITDSKGNVWTALTRYFQTTGPSACAQLYYCWKPTSVGSGHTFSVAAANSGGGTPGIVAAAFSGVNGGFDVQNGASSGGIGFDPGSTYQPGSLTPSNANSLIISCVTDYDTDGVAASIDSGFTVIAGSVSAAGWYDTTMAYIIESSIVAKNPTWTIENANDGRAAAIAAFAPNAASGSIGMKPFF